MNSKPITKPVTHWLYYQSLLEEEAKTSELALVRITTNALAQLIKNAIEKDFEEVDMCNIGSEWAYITERTVTIELKIYHVEMIANLMAHDENRTRWSELNKEATND